MSILGAGYGYAYITVFLWAMYNVIAKVSVEFGVHPAVFVCIGAMMASSALFMFAGAGRLSARTLKQPITMLYSVMNLLEHFFTLHLFMFVAGTEGSLMQRINMSFALLIALMFFSRKPSWKDLLGNGIVLVGIFGVISAVDPEIRSQALVWLGLTVFCQTVKTFLSEIHPESNDAQDYKEHARVTAFVTFVTSFTFFLVLLASAMVKDVGAVDPALAKLLPSFSDFLHPVTFAAALVWGVLNDAPASYYYFYATKTVKSEKFLAVAALVPLFTFMMEWALAQADVIEMRVFNERDLLFVALIVCGSLITVVMPVSHKSYSQRRLR